MNNPDGKVQDVKAATLDGVSLSIEEGVVSIRLISDGGDHFVEVVLGKQIPVS